jgi:CheY-like chemotaxis protein
VEKAYLETLGYEVTAVNDGQEAIDTYQEAMQAQRRYDLVVLDLTVRHGMRGQLTMERLLKLDPSVRAVIASGYVDDPVMERYREYGFIGALKKPFHVLSATV